ANRFGYSVFAEGRWATPLEYLNRLRWHNLIFGDSIRILGIACDEENQIEVVTSQPWISPHEIRPRPFPEEIANYFAGFGFRRVVLNPDAPLFYSEQMRLLAADAHDANVIRDHNGELAAIDVVIGRPGPELLDKVRAFLARQD
ncbi:MAG: hypothetical protein JO295_04915, partial [Verrucomicrobia bacterium]|nr:hypothetical protein [Verrucomicrobiota bacterium]